MGELPEGARGRLLAVLLLVLAVSLLWLGVAAPLQAWWAERDDAIQRQTTLARRMETIAANLPALRRQLETQGPAAPVALLDGNSDAVAGAALQGRLQQMGSSLGAALASAELLPGEKLGAYRRIGVRLALSSPWPVVGKLLEAIEASTPRLFVNDLQIQATRASISDTDPNLNTSLVVFGFRAGEP